MNTVNKIKSARRKIGKSLLSRSAISYLMIAISFAMSVAYSLFDIQWNASKINWGRFIWNIGLLVGVFLIGLFSGWMLESQNVIQDELSEFSKAKALYQAERSKVSPKKQYFGQYRQWEVANEINGLKAKELIDVGWRSTDSDFSDGEILNATAHDIAYYATEEDIRQAAETDSAIEVRRNGHVFYIAKISEKMRDATIKCLNEKCKLRFSEANYYWVDTNFSADDTLPQFAEGLRLGKYNRGKAVGGVASSIMFMFVLALLFAGATIDKFYGNTAEVWINTLSRIGALFGGVLRGIGIVDSYYDGLANQLKDKVNVLEGFYNCVMVDGNFSPDTNTKTAKEIFLKEREKERERRQKELDLEREKVEKPIVEPAPEAEAPEDEKAKPKEADTISLDELTKDLAGKE
jgi:hypothetical protein